MAKSKRLLVYYSRSGNTDKVAQKIKSQFGSNVDKVIYGQTDKVGYISACCQALTKGTAEITGDTHSPSNYEHVIFLTPIWVGRLSTPIRSYIKKFSGSIKSYSLIATAGGDNMSGALKEAKDLLGKEPVNSQVISAKDIKAGSFTVQGLGKK